MNLRFLTPILPLALLLAGCVITPPPSPMAAADPSNPRAPEATAARFRPKLLATNKTFLATSTGANAQQMNMAMSGMDHGSMKMGAEGQMEMEKKKSSEVPTGEQLQSTMPTDFTCPMHPEVKSAKPGECPKCGMTLVSRQSLEKQQATAAAAEKSAATNP